MINSCGINEKILVAGIDGIFKEVNRLIDLFNDCFGNITRVRMPPVNPATITGVGIPSLINTLFGRKRTRRIRPRIYVFTLSSLQMSLWC
jgi:hypothetical protein